MWLPSRFPRLLFLAIALLDTVACNARGAPPVPAPSEKTLVAVGTSVVSGGGSATAPGTGAAGGDLSDGGTPVANLSVATQQRGLQTAPPNAGGAPGSASEVASQATRTLNAAILAQVGAYPWAIPHPYVWARGVNTDGVTQELRWGGTLLAAPQPDGGIHCSGITYEVFLRALEGAVGEGEGPSAETLLALKDPWYVRSGGDQGPAGALVAAGLGDAVDGLAKLKPGDIVQFWRNSGKGHSVVFISHTKNSDGTIRGMKYWSAQGTSGGVGYRYVSPGIDINQIADGRLYGVRARGFGAGNR